MDSSAAPTDVFIAGGDFSAPRKLTNINADAADFTLGDTEVLTWKTADGWESEGILVKPVGYEPGKRYPLLVDVHGGPTGAHTNGFKVGVHNGGQLWAGRGWAVLYPNPRGSTNYGEKFMRGNIPDWGGGDYRDIMAGVDEVIKRGIADPQKLALMGWSYGGYMTSWVVSQTTRFKAARMGAGLSNIHSMYGTTDIPGYIGTFFNNYPDEKTLKLYRERSALTYVDQVTTPLLIMHGQNDERVPIGQPMEFYRALKDRGKIVELVWYPREGHSNSEYLPSAGSDPPRARVDDEVRPRRSADDDVESVREPPRRATPQFVCSALVGSTPAARRAGTTLAISPTKPRPSATITNVSGSLAVTPNNCAESTRVAANDALIPTSNPIEIGIAACRTTRPTTSRLVAPSAMRTPISCVRRLTK